MKKKTLIPTALLGVAAATSFGLLGLQSVGTSAAPAETTAVGDAFIKRDEDQTEVVLVADADDDDTNDDTNDNTRSRFTGVSRNTNDNTRSNFTRVSRDRDRSRSDKTRDWTHDGKGPLKRDWSANSTNDRSRNDSRGRR